MTILWKTNLFSPGNNWKINHLVLFKNYSLTHSLEIRKPIRNKTTIDWTKDDHWTIPYEGCVLYIN